MIALRWGLTVLGPAAAAAACATSTNMYGFGGSGGTADGRVDDDASSGDVTISGDAAAFGDGALAEVGSQCEPPDMLVVLDHTDSMMNTPTGGTPANTPAGHAKTKWVIACDAVRGLVAPPADTHSRFGLELFPLDPKVITDAGSTGSCMTLTQMLGGTVSTNTRCQAAEVLVPPGLGTGTMIQGILDPETLRLCISTPIAGALDTATGELKSIADPNRKQFIVLVTDGGESCMGDSIGAAQALAAAGIETYVVGFGSGDAGSAGVNIGLLDDLACAGMTAANFATSCIKMGAGYVATTHTGPPVFFLAEDATALQQALQTIQTATCCGCTH
jgi:hypothetical protein